MTLYLGLLFTFILALAWYPCCTITSPPCGKCSADASTITITLAGFSTRGGDAICDCTIINTAYVCYRSANACLWNSYNGLSSEKCEWSGADPGDTDLEWSMYGKVEDTLGIGNIGWRVQVYLETVSKSGWYTYTDGVSFIKDVTTNATFDCTVNHSIPSYGFDSTTEVCNDLGSVTCQVN